MNALVLLVGAGAAVAIAASRRPKMSVSRGGAIGFQRAIERPDCWPMGRRFVPILGSVVLPVPYGSWVTGARNVVEKYPQTILWEPCDRSRLPADASHLADHYSLGVFVLMNLSGGGIRVDEWGRPYGGTGPGFLERLFDSAFWDLAADAAYFIPGFGPAASAGLTAMVSMARGESAEEALALAGCAALSPAASVACRAGVGGAATGLRGGDLDDVRTRVVGELGGEQGAFDAGVQAWESLR